MSLTSVVLFRSLVPVALAVASSAQVQVTWSTYLGGNPLMLESASASTVDGSGATFVAGARDVDPGGAIALDAALTKVASNGVVAWTRTYDEPTGGNQLFEFVGADAAGNAAVAGRTHAQTATIVASYDSSGNQRWLSLLTNPQGLSLTTQAMCVAPGGDVFLAGYSNFSSSPPVAFVTRIRPDGTTAWTHEQPASSGQGSSASRLVLDAAGNVFATGQVADASETVSGIFALKLGFDGTVVWSTEFLPPATGHHQGASQQAAVDAQGRFYVGDSLNVNGSPFLGLVQFDANGAFAWSRQMSAGSSAGRVVGVAVREDGSVLLGAWLSNSQAAAAEGLVRAWDETGAELWSASYAAPGSQQENVTDFDLDPAGGAILTGWNQSSTGSRVLFAAHFTDDGQQDWTQLLGSGTARESEPQLHVAADDSLRVRSNWNSGVDWRIQIRRLEHDVTAFCSGDGSAAACPCGNLGGPRAGCANSFGVGAALGASGSPSLAFDTLRLRCDDLPSTTVLFFQGTVRQSGGSGVAFGDGLRCAGGSLVRLQSESAEDSVEFPTAGEPLSVLGQVTAPGLRTYQCWYRNSASFCTPETFNTSNGLAVLWRP